MRTRLLLLLVLVGCEAPPAQAPPAPSEPRIVRGRVVRVDEDDREVGPAPRVRVKGTGAASVAGEPPGRTDGLGIALSGPDGRFEIPLPEPLASAIGARTTWTWWIRLEVEDDEVVGTPPVDLRGTDALDGIVLRMERPDPDLPARVRKRFEDLRISPAKANYRYGMDIGGLFSEDDLVMRLSNCASTSRAGRGVLKEYEKDRDENLRALAYELLAWHKDSEDEAGRPQGAGDPDSARRMLQWAFHAVASSKHGGHLELGVDLDDLCSRCYGVYEDAVAAAHVLGPEATKTALDSTPSNPGQAAILRRLVLEELDAVARVKQIEREMLEAKPDFSLPPTARIDGEAILIPETFSVKLVRPVRDAEPVVLSPRWLDFKAQGWTADGSRVLGIGGIHGIWDREDLWVLDLRSLQGSRVAWSGVKFHEAGWLPDGRRAAFIARRDPRREVGLLDSRSGASSRVLEMTGFLSGLAVDPDAKRAVVLASDGTARHGIDLINLASGKAERILEGEASESPRWSPDGRRLALVRRQTLEILDLATREVRPIARLLSRRAPFAWSPEGGRLAYAAFPAWEEKRGKGRLMVVSLDGSAPKPLAEFDSELGEYAPAWSPDGRRIAFVASRNERAWVHVVSDDGRTLFPVCEGGELGFRIVCPSLSWRAAPK